ncbi:hypothetical protein SGRIM128S_07785 [Streptomyces griseomycini]
MGVTARPFGAAAAHVRGEVRARRFPRREVVAVDEGAAGAQQGGETAVGVQQHRLGEVVQGRRRDGGVQGALQPEGVGPALLADHRVDVAGGVGVVGAAQLQQQRIHVDGDDLRVRQAAGEPGGQGTGTAAQVEQERPGAAGRDVLDDVRDHGEPLLAGHRVALLLPFPALHPRPGRRHAHAHPVAHLFRLSPVRGHGRIYRWKRLSVAFHVKDARTASNRSISSTVLYTCRLTRTAPSFSSAPAWQRLSARTMKPWL